MHFSWSLLITLLPLGIQASSDTLDYAGSIQALAYGNVETQGDTAGEVWFNVTGFAPDKLPEIQDDLGIHTLDNLEALKAIADLGATAASEQKWGDIVFLYNAFAQNAHAEHVKVDSSAMREGLLLAVLQPDGTGVDASLVKLYSETSSSPELAAVFKTLLTAVAPAHEKRDMRSRCSSAHQAFKSICSSLAESIRFDVSAKTNGPRNICRNGCCISWSGNATFQVRNLYPAANLCLATCGTVEVSCNVAGVQLGSRIVDQCVSNRANGCT